MWLIQGNAAGDVAGTGFTGRPRLRVGTAQHAAWQCDVHALDRVVEQVRVQGDDAEDPSRVVGASDVTPGVSR
jgi:hypothetical protein